jgi:hypothetical protein
MRSDASSRWENGLCHLPVRLRGARKAPKIILLRQFPEAYPAYQRRVKAIIPFVL